MMKRIFTLGVLLLCLSATQTAYAAEDRDAKIKAEMVQNYLLWEVALKNKDAERIISFESPDFIWISQDARGRRTKEEADEALRASMQAIQEVHEARVAIKRLIIESNRVVVVCRQYFDVNALTTDGGIIRISSSAEARDIWVEYDQVWMLKRREYGIPKVRIRFPNEPD